MRKSELHRLPRHLHFSRKLSELRRAWSRVKTRAVGATCPPKPSPCRDLGEAQVGAGGECSGHLCRRSRWTAIPKKAQVARNTATNKNSPTREGWGSCGLRPAEGGTVITSSRRARRQNRRARRRNLPGGVHAPQAAALRSR